MLTVAAILAGSFLILNYVVMPLYVNQGATLKVPKVTGIKVERARAVLDSVGLEVVESQDRQDSRAPVGTVILQNPPANSEVKGGRRVYLTVSMGEARVVVPNLKGRSTRDARFALERVGLVLGPITYAASDTYPENTLIDQAPQPTREVARGSAVAVVVSRGRATAEANVPALVGKTIKEAEQLLAKAGLRVGNITYQTGYDLVPNTVVDQFPREGESVPDSQAVDLFVVKPGTPKL